MYVYCQKIKTLYVRALETGRKANIYRVFFVFRSEEKQLYFNRKTDRHDITEILLKVALSTINLNRNSQNGRSFTFSFE
jgi:hypothetical protein